MPRLRLDRAAIAKLAQGVPQTIRALEEIFGDVDGTLPSTIEEANALAGQALALVQVQASLLSLMAEALERLESAPAPLPQVDPDDTAPRAHVGTLASQNADQVDIAGGAATLDTLTVLGQVTSMVETGAPPFLISSTDLVENLYVERSALADESTRLTDPTTFPPVASDLATVITLANALRAAGIAKGL